jgi:hypothetical protein
MMGIRRGRGMKGIVMRATKGREIGNLRKRIL